MAGGGSHPRPGKLRRPTGSARGWPAVGDGGGIDEILPQNEWMLERKNATERRINNIHTPKENKPTGMKLPGSLLNHISNLNGNQVKKKSGNSHVHAKSTPSSGKKTSGRVYKHLIPLIIGSRNGELACTAMVDSGNVWRNVMSEGLFYKLGFNKDDLHIVQGQSSVGTAKEGADLKVLGEMKNAIHLKFGDHGCRFKDKPVVLAGLSMDFNISGPFLKRHQINQLHDIDCLGIQGRKVPLIGALKEEDVVESEFLSTPIIVGEEVTIPPGQSLLVSAVAPYVRDQKQPSGDAFIRGSHDFMTRTDLHPWLDVLGQIQPDGSTVVGMMNTTLQPVKVEKGAKYGTMRLAAKESERKKYPWRITHLDHARWRKDKEEGKEIPEPGRDKRGLELPGWMKGPTTEDNSKRRIDHLITTFKLEEKKCLTDEADVVRAAVLLLKYWDVFSFDGSYGRTTLLKHNIRLKPDQHPINQRYRPVNPALEGDLQKQIDTWLKHGVIEKSNSPWNFGLVAAPKKDGRIRWCVDYRALNAATIPDRHPVGHIQDNLARLSRSTIFSGLDGTGAFHVIDLEDKDKEKTSFATPMGSYQFLQLPFGLSGGPSTYARLVHLVLQGIPYDVALPYLDDTVVHTSTLEGHFSAMDRVLTAMRKGGLKLNPDKCEIFSDEIDYLGHRVTAQGIGTIPEYTQVVKEWPMPDTRTKIRAFLGKTGYYRQFIKNYSAMAAALHDATTYPKGDDINKKALDKEIITVTPKMEEAHRKLKDALMNTPILAYPDFKSKEPFILDTDWSLENNAIGAVLSQVQQGRERVICYGGKKLSPSQASYPSTKGELAAVIIFIEKWRYFLQHRPFKLRTDNAALKWIHSMEAPKGMIQRWLQVLSNHKFTVEHRAGTKHGNADGLSRAPHLKDEGDTDVSEGEQLASLGNNLKTTDSEAKQRFDNWRSWVNSILGTEAENKISSLEEPENEPWSREFLIEKQEQDEELRLITDRIRENGQLTNAEVRTLSQHARVWHGLTASLRTDHQGLTKYYKSGPGPGSSKGLILLTPDLWKEAVRRAHEAVAHRGVTATTDQLMKHFYFPSMTKSVQEAILACEPCQRRESKGKDQKHTLQSHLDGYPWQKISVDFVGPLPKSTQGNEYLFTIRDTFTRWVEAFPIRRATAEAVVRILTEQVFPRFGLCEQIHSDRGTQFTSHLLREVSQILNIRATTTPAYNPKSNPVERMHRDLGRAITALVDQKPSKWEEVLPHVLFVMRTTPCRSTGFSPYKLLFGRDATEPLDLIFGPPPYTRSEYRTELEYVEALKNRILSAHTWARKQMGTTVVRQRSAYWKDKPLPYIPGEQVWLFTPTNKPGKRRKFTTHWTGPWTVKRRVNDLCFELYPDARWSFFNKPVVVSIDRLRRFYSEEVPDDYTQPPTFGDDIERLGDEFAENIPHGENEREDDEGADTPPVGGNPLPAGPAAGAGAAPPPPAPFQPAAGDGQVRPAPPANPVAPRQGPPAGGNPGGAGPRPLLRPAVLRPARLPHGPLLDRARDAMQADRARMAQNQEIQDQAREARAQNRRNRAAGPEPPPARRWPNV